MMKNSLIAAAALLAVAGAQAQTAAPTVTVFGLVDVNLSNYSAGDKSGAKSKNSLNDGTANGLNGSRWGLRVSQDVANGLKAGALLEGGFTANNGNLGQGGRGFGRQAFISLASANLGELRLGRQYILSDSVMGLSNPFGNALTLNPGTGVTVSGKDLPAWLNAPRADNVIQYQTPNFSGVTLAAQVAPETPNPTGATSGVDGFRGLKLAYSSGQFNAALSSEWNVARTTRDKVNKSQTLGLNYNFGNFKLLGGLQKNSDLVTGSGNGAFTGSNLSVVGDSTFTATKIDGSTLGVEVPTGDFLFGLNYTKVKYGSATGVSQSLGKVAAGVRYTLSGNAYLYTSLSTANGDLADYVAQQRVFQVGTRLSF
jgi:GBP family porin